jgi:hypothetical protein
MANIRSFFANAYEVNLTAEMGAEDVVMSVSSTDGAPASPAYIVVEPDTPGQREYILFDGTIGGNQFETTTLTNRYLTGSAAASGLTHPVGSVVRVSPLMQHFDDLHDRVEARLTITGHTKAIHEGFGFLDVSGLSPEEGDAVLYDGTNWTAGPPGVDIPVSSTPPESPEQDDFWVDLNAAAIPVTTLLGGLANVEAPSPDDGDVLAYDSGTSEWVASNAYLTVPTGVTEGDLFILEATASGFTWAQVEEIA